MYLGASSTVGSGTAKCLCKKQLAFFEILFVYQRTDSKRVYRAEACAESILDFAGCRKAASEVFV